ncbi:MAG TPA: alpha/beta hydrolase [Terriglobia bacterium]|nr:alpha/beta hydrolase [Terriglobia bacterium]
MAASSSKVTYRLRGVDQTLFYFAPQAPEKNEVALVLSGDGGWHGFIIEVAAHLADAGYPTFGVDSKDYLESLSKPKALEPAQVTSDLGELLRLALSRSGKAHGILVGWSEGAGLGVLGGLHAGTRDSLLGVVAIGLPELNELAWRMSDAIIYITKKVPNEPTFRSQDYIAGVSPLPLMMIQSTHDDFVPEDVAKKLFEIAKEPKRQVFVQAHNHHYEGGEAEFYRALDGALDWFREPAKPPR